MIILSSPSGAGKTTLTKKIQQKYENFKISVSHTTRKPRSNEVEGVDYFFIDHDEFKKKIKNNEFYEYAKIFDNYYGTSKKSVNILLESKNDILFDIDWQGTQQLSKFKELKLIKIFLVPPNKKELEKYKNLEIVNEDILKFKLEKKIKKNSIIVGNLPYNISSQILARLIKFEKWPPKYKKLILMFQKEVADKILAKHGSSSFGRLSILTSSRLKITNSFNISQTCFYPVPKIRSTVLVFEPIINENFNVKNITNLEMVTHIFFSKKRKMINKAFKELFGDLAYIEKKININLNLRPSQLSEKEYYKITEYFEKFK